MKFNPIGKYETFKEYDLYTEEQFKENNYCW